MIDSALQKYMRQFLERDLGLRPEPELSTTPEVWDLTEILGAMQAQQLALEQKEEERREEAKRLKTAEEHYIKLNYKKLLLLTNLEDEDDLPLVCGQLANCKKPQTHHQIIQDNVNDVAAEKGCRAPCVQVGCQSYFSYLNFHGNDRYDVAAGFGVMNVVPAGAVSRNALAMQVSFVEDARDNN